MRTKLNITEGIFPMPVLMVATYNKDGCGVIGKVVSVTADENVMINGKIDMSLVNAIAFDPYTHGYYKVTEKCRDFFKRKRCIFHKQNGTFHSFFQAGFL